MNEKDRVPPALLTDFYQLTMAYGYWKKQMLEHQAIFHLSFRQQPFNGGYAITCGLSDAIDYLQNFKFRPRRPRLSDRAARIGRRTVFRNEVSGLSADAPIRVRC